MNGNGKIKYWDFVVTGYLQNEASDTRMLGLWKKLHAGLAGPDHVVFPMVWNSRWADQAAFVDKMSAYPPIIRCYCYSWGGGWGFLTFAKELDKRGLGISHAVLSDAIYRHCYLFGRWKAIWPNARIVVPHNVKKVDWFYQRQDRWLRGHQVIAADTEKTYVSRGIELHASHVNMDDQHQFLDKCLQVAGVPGEG